MSITRDIVNGLSGGSATNSNVASAVVNTPTTLNNMNLLSIQKIGTTEFLYTGTGASLVVPTTAVQIANDNGDGTTLAVDWVSATAYVVGDIVYDNSTTGDARAYECIVNTSGIVSPLLDTNNWKLADNQFGYKLIIKSRSAIGNHNGFDSIRRETNEIYSNGTAIEATNATGLTTVSPFSITLGTGTHLNTLNDTYVLTVEQTIRKTAGYRTDAGVIQNSKNNTGTDLLETDSAGQPQIRHYNPVQGNEIVMHTGNGLAGRNITTGGKYDLAHTKGLTGALSDWYTYNSYDGATKYQRLNTTIASTVSAAAFNDTEPTENTFTFGYALNWTNNSNDQYITYGYSQTANKKIVVYQGTGAIGNDALNNIGMDCTVSGTSVIIKALTLAQSWDYLSVLRGTQASLLLDSSAAETDDTSNPIIFTNTGIIVNGTGLRTNSSGGTYLAIISTPNYAQPTGGKEITFNSGIEVTGANGKINGALSTLRKATTSQQLLDIGTGNESKKLQLFIDAVSGVGSASEIFMNSGLTRAKADTWGVDVVDATGTVTGKTTARHGTYSSDTGFVSASSENSTVANSYKAFNKSTTTNDGWITLAGDNVGAWIQYDFLEKRVVKTLEYITYNSADYNYASEVSIFGVNDDSSLTLIKAFTGIALTQASSTGKLDLLNTTEYKGVRLVVDAYVDVSSVNTWVAFGEIIYEFDVSNAPYLDIAQNKVLDTTDVQENRVPIAEVDIDAQGLAYNLVEYEADEAHTNGFTAHGVAYLKDNAYIITPQNEEALPDLVTANKRYILDYPKGFNELNTIAIAEIFANGIWAETTIANTSTTTAVLYGTKAITAPNGVIVATGSGSVVYDNYLQTHGGSGALTSAPCRVRLSLIGGK